MELLAFLAVAVTLAFHDWLSDMCTGNSQVLAIFGDGQVLILYVVCGLDWVLLLRCGADHLAFAGVKGHYPVFVPFLEFIQIALYCIGVSSSANLPM